MKRILAILFVAVVCVSAVFAQSGRRVAPTPTPEIKVDTPDSYSETKPNPQRPSRVLPSMRAPTNDAPKPVADTSNKTTTVENEDAEIKVDTNLITIPVSVFDRNGLYIPNIQQNEFKIFEDGVEQEIAYFATSDKPFSVILLLDVSYSTHYKIDEIKDSAKAFVDQLKPVDKVMVIEFSESVRIRTEFTSDRREIFRAIDKADFGSGTSLYDAVDTSLRKQLSKIEGRKAVVLFTDGVDTTSRKATYDSTLEYAEELDALIFGIYYNTYSQNRGGGTGSVSWPSSSWPFPNIGGQPRGATASEYALGKRYVDELAAYTGGRVFSPDATPGGLTRAFEGIAEELRRQYSIGFIPSDDGKPGQRKQIKVRVSRPSLLVRSRDSYIVPAK